VTVTLSDVIIEDEGELEGIPATGKPVTYSGITLLRVRDGKVAEDQFESSSPSAQEQLGTPPG
jgi:predicted ester cyclase